MLAPQKANPKKVAVYSVVLVAIFGAIGWILYTNVFSSNVAINDTAVSTDTVDVTDTATTTPTPDDISVYDEHELDFLQSPQFRRLVDNTESVEPGPGNNSSPFIIKLLQ
ncbi:MAG: hypothetical protein Q8Q23_05655 [bacterium]|nr:hypothetical protein [bacterium]